MKKIGFILAVILALLTQSAGADADQRVRMRSDGRITDINGNIIAVPNVSDSRNNSFDRYYVGVDKNGATIKGSDFYINADKDAGFLRKEINKPPAPVPAPVAPPEAVEKKGGKIAPTTQTIQKDGDKPIYDILPEQGQVYE